MNHANSQTQRAPADGSRHTALPPARTGRLPRTRQRDRCADRAAHRRDDDDLDAYIKEMIGSAPPLTSEQRDKLALLLHRHRAR